MAINPKDRWCDEQKRLWEKDQEAERQSWQTDFFALARLVIVMGVILTLTCLSVRLVMRL